MPEVIPSMMSQSTLLPHEANNNATSADSAHAQPLQAQQCSLPALHMLLMKLAECVLLYEELLGVTQLHKVRSLQHR
jgi:hypothetical protein